MGLLDDAIREHLELQRRHGASREELERQEQEALGPARQGEFARPKPEPADAPPPAEESAAAEPSPVAPPPAPARGPPPPPPPPPPRGGGGGGGRRGGSRGSTSPTRSRPRTPWSMTTR